MEARHHDDMADMADMTMTSTATAAAATGTMGMDHSGMGMGGGDGMECKISMLLNYNTIGSCFISSDWQVTSTGMFAGSCIGVVLLAIFLEFLRRSVKEFDKLILNQHIKKHAGASPSSAASADASDNGSGKGGASAAVATGCVSVPPFRPSFWQQAIRAVLHTAQFTVAYFIMLLGTCFPLALDHASEIVARGR